MQKQKKNYVATIDGVPTITFDAAVSFTTDPIEFPESTPWAVQFDEWDVTGGAKASILCSNSQFGDYYPYDVDLSTNVNRILYDAIFAPRYMKIAYTADDSVGYFNLVISK
jgi:hypothetical protein